MTWKSGLQYVGAFENGYMHGKGKLTKGDGYFEGTFANGLKQEGKMKTAFGQYEGKFVNGNMHDANGKFTWNDKKVYNGGFEFNELHGKGKIVYPNNQVAAGTWERGENAQIDTVGK